MNYRIWDTFMRRLSIDSLVPNIIDSLAIATIGGYQRYLSPYKGFKCAHRVLHRGESCSQYVKRVVREEGLGVAIEKSRVRFAECKEANRLLKARCKFQLANVATSSLSMSNGGIPTPEDIERVERERDRKSNVNKKNNNNNSNCCNDCSNCDPLSGVNCNDCNFPDAHSHCGHLDNCGDCGDCSNVGDCGDCSGCGDCGSCSN